ncbi:oxidoreductase FAD-binding subunit [Salinisphaera sp. S4-8]|uniref:ferredoxin reductase n=1 Tax=Salinisphaera sp. S4-8 TaxID=633357 RepID=UPI003341F55E
MNPVMKKVLGSSVVSALTSPLSVDDYLALIDGRLSLTEPRGRVTHAVRQTPDSVTLVIEPNDNWRGHRPGQHVLLGVDLDGVRHSRCFSVASAPGEKMLEITVKRNGDGRVSNYLVDHATRGQLVYLSPAEGEFYAQSRAPQQALLLSAGSGITPVMGVLRHWIARGELHDVVFVHYARTRADMIYAEELEALAARHSGLRVESVFTADGGQRLDDASLQNMVSDLAARETWMCGPAGFMDAAEPLITARSDAPLHREHFAATRRDAAQGEGAVQFLKSDVAASGESGSLLEVAEGAGLKPNYGCRMGICHACKCRVAEGSVRDLRTNRVRQVRDTDIQLCIHAAAGDVAVEL